MAHDHAHHDVHGHGGSPTQVLMEEHELILAALEALGKKLTTLEEPRVADRAYFEKAVDFLKNFADKCHHGKEEELLLPVYARAGTIPGGPLVLFTGEHQKMREFIEAVQLTLSWVESNPAALSRGVLRLLDHEATFKHLLEHHDQREANILYPALDRVTSEGERRDLVARCLARRA